MDPHVGGGTNPASQLIVTGLQVSDQLVEINGDSTAGMTHSQAVEQIRRGGHRIHLVLKRGNGYVPDYGTRSEESDPNQVFWCFLSTICLFDWNLQKLTSHFSECLFLPPLFPLSAFPSVPALSLSGALQSVSLHDQLQTRRALLLCHWTDREYAVGNGSC